MTLGMHVIWDPLAKPKATNKSPRPLCHASTKALYDGFKRSHKKFLEAYKEASALFRQGMHRIEFPPFCFRPILPYNWAAVDT